MYSALKKYKNNYKILKIILVPDFCRLKPEIARFSIDLIGRPLLDLGHDVILVNLHPHRSTILILYKCKRFLFFNCKFKI